MKFKFQINSWWFIIHSSVEREVVFEDRTPAHAGSRLFPKLCISNIPALDHIWFANFSQIMWVSVLTARQQLLWEFSNVCVVKKTTTTIGSQRWYFNGINWREDWISNENAEKYGVHTWINPSRMQFALLPRVFTIWWKRCRWIFTNHRCLR